MNKQEKHNALQFLVSLRIAFKCRTDKIIQDELNSEKKRRQCVPNMRELIRK